MSGRLRRMAARLGLAATPCQVEAARELDPAQRAWLREDIREDLAAMVDDAETRGVGGPTAREMLVVGSLVGWLEGGERPVPEAIGYLERILGAMPHDPGEKELVLRDACLAAVGELGGDQEAAAGLRREDVHEQMCPLLDLQSRKLRGRMEELGLTTGELARRSGIDRVTLVALLSGQEEMRIGQWIDLSVALGVPLGWIVEGARFTPRTDPDGRGSCEIDPESDEARPGAGGGDEGR